MNAEAVKKALNDTIQAMTENKQFFSRRPDKDYTRTRKLTFEKMIAAVLAFRAGTLNHEMMDFSGWSLLLQLLLPLFSKGQKLHRTHLSIYSEASPKKLTKINGTADTAC